MGVRQRATPPPLAAHCRCLHLLTCAPPLRLRHPGMLLGVWLCVAESRPAPPCSTLPVPAFPLFLCLRIAARPSLILTSLLLVSCVSGFLFLSRVSRRMVVVVVVVGVWSAPPCLKQ